MAAVFGLFPVLQPSAWVPQSLLVIVATTAAAVLVRVRFGAAPAAPERGSGLTAVRLRGLRAAAPTLAAVAVLVAINVPLHAPDTAIAGIVPTPATVDRFVDLAVEGQLSIASQAIPAVASPGIALLLTLGLGLVAISIDVLGGALRLPAATAIPLLAVLGIPGVVVTGTTSWLAFMVASGCWLLALWLHGARARARQALTIGAVVLAGTLVIGPSLMGFALPRSNGTGFNGLQVGVNPLIDLGTDLRRDVEITALDYTTTLETGTYLRMATLDRIEGHEWVPAGVIIDSSNTVDAIPEPPGTGADVVTEQVTTTIRIGSVVARWLPLPYAPRKVDGLIGRWYWEERGHAVRGADTFIRGQEYTVVSDWVRPTAAQLRAAGNSVPRSVRAYLELDRARLPENIVDETMRITSGLTSAYERAEALQAHFRSGGFVYSEEAPVDRDYDGSGLDVISRFLEEKSGYCVHFSSAMAVMARVAGIPARIAVGFLPGTAEYDPTIGDERYTVLSSELHAWPELYFDGVGWVAFEPTPGRGVAPDFEAPVVDDPSTPDVDESRPQPPDAAVPGGPSASPTLDPRDENVTEAADLSDDVTGVVLTGAVFAVILALACAPGVVRGVLRRRRLRSADPVTLWHEICATAEDAGIAPRVVETPRAYCARLVEHGGAPASATYALLEAAERRWFGRHVAPAAHVDELQGAARAVVSGIRESLRPGRRVLAMIAPLSVLRGRSGASVAPPSSVSMSTGGGD
ncbi:transglutaminase TgpA family protein [Ruicaihuangia caeni]|uniref:transglutaminase TgpA family protein n=1 Tax=Ruicaihuangia caeni TaxID=3042517 RepID=UPI00338DF8F0